MATKIVTKNSSTASAVPTASDLVQGELAVNVADKRLFTEDNGGSIVELGTNPSTIDIDAGSIDGTAIGASSASTGAFTTLTASGIDVTGTATMDGLTVDGAYTDVKFKTTQGRLDLWLTDTDTTEGQVRVRGDANNLVFITDTTERMRINSSGNVGIGTSSPVYSLDVRGEAGIELYNASGGGDVLNLRPSLGDANKYNMSISSYDHSGGGVGPADGISINAFDGVSVATGSSTARQERMRIDSSGNVGIGTSSPSTALDVVGTVTADGLTVGTTSDAYSQVLINSSTTGESELRMGDTDTDAGSIAYNNADNSMQFRANAAERMRIDSSGNLLVGKSAIGFSNVGLEARASGTAYITASGAQPLVLNRKSSDGDIVSFYKDGSTVGSIGSYIAYMYIGSTGGVDTHIGFVNGTVRPATATGGLLDNALDLGSSGSRWVDIYATNGTIQTSDRNEKQDIAELSDAEQRVAVAAKGLLRKFRWKDSVAEKGDDARIHFGIIAQDLQAAFEAEGLDAGDYAMFISTTWTDEETNEEKTRMGVRYSELLAFIISAI